MQNALKKNNETGGKNAVDCHLSFVDDIAESKKNGTGCPITSAIDIIGGKWKLAVLYHLRDKTLRFSELRKLLPAVTQKMLTQQLRDMEKDGLVTRKVYPEVPPKVEYNITPIAKKLAPVLAAMCNWSSEYRKARKEQ